MTTQTASPPVPKPILKVRVGRSRSFVDGAYVYLIVSPQFQKLGYSGNPEKRRDELQEQLGWDVPLILARARIFHTRGEAFGYENRLHKKYEQWRIPPPKNVRRNSREYYSPEVEIQL